MNSNLCAGVGPKNAAAMVSGTRISIVAITRNTRGFVEDSIKSVIRQTYKDFEYEYIVVNGLATMHHISVKLLFQHLNLLISTHTSICGNVRSETSQGSVTIWG